MFKVEVWDGREISVVPVLDAKTNLPDSLPLWAKLNIIRYSAKTFNKSVYIDKEGSVRICETARKGEKLVVGGL